MDLEQQIKNSLEFIAQIETVEWPALHDKLLAAPPDSPEQAELKKKAIGLWWGFQTHLSCLRAFRRSESLNEIEEFVKNIGE